MIRTSGRLNPHVEIDMTITLFDAIGERVHLTRILPYGVPCPLQYQGRSCFRTSVDPAEVLQHFVHVDHLPSAGHYAFDVSLLDRLIYHISRDLRVLIAFMYLFQSCPNTSYPRCIHLSSTNINANTLKFRNNVIHR